MYEPQHPEPPGVKPVKGFSVVRTLIGALVVLALAAAAFLVPIPVFYEYLPGPVRDIERLVEVSGGPTYSSEGELLLTTVSVDPHVTFADMVASQFDDSTAIVLKEQVTGGQSFDELLKDQRVQMRDSQRRAQEVALDRLGLGSPEGDGAEVTETVPDSPADQTLRAGDVIVRIDDSAVQTTCDVGEAIDRQGIGEEITVVVRRDGRRVPVTLTTGENPDSPGSPFIGVYMRDLNYRFDPGVDVSFATGKIGGPSAGLMMALALYDRLTPDDLTGGRKIAGTGEIACDGGVGPIGGIEQKVAGAERAGAEIFLAPRGNASAARRVAEDIQIVAIGNFDDAVGFLEGLD